MRFYIANTTYVLTSTGIENCIVCCGRWAHDTTGVDGFTTRVHSPSTRVYRNFRSRATFKIAVGPWCSSSASDSFSRFLALCKCVYACRPMYVVSLSWLFAWPGHFSDASAAYDRRSRPTVQHSHHHHHHHFICPIIQQYTHLHEYGLEEQDSKVR